MKNCKYDTDHGDVELLIMQGTSAVRYAMESLNHLQDVLGALTDTNETIRQGRHTAMSRQEWEEWVNWKAQRGNGKTTGGYKRKHH